MFNVYLTLLHAVMAFCYTIMTADQTTKTGIITGVCLVVLFSATAIISFIKGMQE